MLGWTMLTRTVSVWRRTTPCAKRRRVSARRKIRSRSRPTSTHATEDDDIVGALTWLSKIDPSTDPKVETEKLSVKMRLAKAICWSHAKFGDDAEKPVSDDAKKALAEATQLLESVLEQSSKSSLTYEALKTKLQIHLLSHQRGSRGAGEAPGAQQRERDG